LPARRETVTAAPARAELKLLGQRVDEALAELESFLNRAALEGYGELRVVHGAGSGALRRAVREHLTDHPLVEEFRSGAPYEGGDGATVVRLR
jgi:DNA mismatch repair protein MutS2